MAKIILLILVTISLFLETVFFSFPFFLIFAIILLLLDSRPFIIVFIFSTGLILDSLRLEILGITPLVIFATATLIYIYRRSFEITHLAFILVCLFAVTYFYAGLTHHYFNIIVYLAFMIISFIGYTFLQLKFSQNT